jgi:hypothetical protein
MSEVLLTPNPHQLMTRFVAPGFRQCERTTEVLDRERRPKTSS